MSSYLPFGFGQRFLMDAHQRFTRTGLQVYLRCKNFQDVGDFAEVGVPFTPTGTAADQSGFVDILIDPPPSVREVSMHNLGLFGGRLNFGAREFWVSHTFVLAQLAILEPSGVTDPYAVFRNRDGNACIGIVYNGRLFDIVSLIHQEVGGETLQWHILCNAHEDAISNPPSISI